MAISWDGANWQPSTPYLFGARVVNGASTGGNVYQCIVAGTSASSGGPTGTALPITDGSVTWNYLGPFTGSVLSVSPVLATGGSPTPFAAQVLYLSLAERLVADVSIWGELLDDGRRYLAAHYGELARLRGKGPVTSETVGPMAQATAALTGPFATNLTPSGMGYHDLYMTLPTIFGFC